MKKQVRLQPYNMVALTERYEMIDGQMKLRCKYRGCGNLLGTVVDEGKEICLELPQEYTWINNVRPEQCSLYGYRRWIDDAVLYLRMKPDLEATRATCYSTSRSAKMFQNEGLVRVSLHELPVFVACAEGHAFYRISTFPGAPPLITEEELNSMDIL